MTASSRERRALRALVRRRRSFGRLVACYEAGPTGYDTYRLLIWPTLSAAGRGASVRVKVRHLCPILALVPLSRRPGHGGLRQGRRPLNLLKKRDIRLERRLARVFPDCDSS